MESYSKKRTIKNFFRQFLSEEEIKQNSNSVKLLMSKNDFYSLSKNCMVYSSTGNEFEKLFQSKACYIKWENEKKAFTIMLDRHMSSMVLELGEDIIIPKHNPIFIIQANNEEINEINSDPSLKQIEELEENLHIQKKLINGYLTEINTLRAENERLRTQLTNTK